jgi:flagellar protein FliO/FliZ
MRKLLLIILLLMPLWVSAAPGESAGPELDMVGSSAQMLLGLVVVLGLMAGAVWLLRRYTPLQRGDGALKIVGGLALGTRERLVLVETGGVRLLLGVMPGKVERLHVFEATDTDNFAAHLAKSSHSTVSHEQEASR